MSVQLCGNGKIIGRQLASRTKNWQHIYPDRSDGPPFSQWAGRLGHRQDWEATYWVPRNPDGKGNRNV